VDGMSIKMVTT